MTNKNVDEITPDSEVSMHQVLRLFTSKWRYLLILALIFSLGAVVKHKYFPKYPAEAKLIIKNADNSQVEHFFKSFLGNMSGPSNKKGHEANTLAIVYLKTNKYFLRLAERVMELQSSKDTDPKVVHTFTKYFGRFKTKAGDDKFKQRLADSIRGKIRFSPARTGQIVFKVKSYRKSFSVHLVNVAIQVAKELLTDIEVDNYLKAEKFFEGEIADLAFNLKRLEEESIFKMKKSEAVSTELEKEEGSHYLDNLRQNIADVKVKISENDKLIQSLKERGKGVTDNPASSSSITKFGASSQIKVLEDENKVLKIRRETYESHLEENLKAYMKKVLVQKRELLSFKSEIEKLKQNYLLEYQIYKDLKDKLVRIKLQRTHTKNRIEILEEARSGRVRSYPGLMMMILIAIMLSQALGLGAIYLFEIFRPRP